MDAAQDLLASELSVLTIWSSNFNFITQTSQRLFSERLLAQFDGKVEGKPIYLAASLQFYRHKHLLICSYYWYIRLMVTCTMLLVEQHTNLVAHTTSCKLNHYYFLRTILNFSTAELVSMLQEPLEQDAFRPTGLMILVAYLIAK